MKVLVGVSRIFVGIFFIISGFIKLNDPLGFSFKLQEYFGEGVLNMEFLIPFALLIAVFVVIFEVVLGITLIIGYAPKFTVWSLLLMIGFFTFLTFYSAYFNKVTDCGCFGDAMKLTPWESFSKDVFLTVLIALLFWKKQFITPLIPKGALKWVVFVSFIACLSFAYHVLMHLPSIDFRAYKVGVNITKGMEIPEGAPRAKIAYNWVFEENGQEKVITTSRDYPKTTGKFVRVDTEILDKGYEPPIHDFSITKDDQDFTTKFLAKEKLIVIVAYNLSKSEVEGLEKISSLSKRALEQGYDVIALSASGPADIAKLKQRFDLPFEFYVTDETALKTIIRSNPGILRLQEGTIMQKLHWNDADDLAL